MVRNIDRTRRDAIRNRRVQNEEEGSSPTFRILSGFITENAGYIRDARMDADSPLIVAEKKAQNEATLKKVRETYAKLSVEEKAKFAEFFEERHRTLLALQPKDSKKADEDEKASERKLEDLKYFGKLIGLEVLTK